MIDIVDRLSFDATRCEVSFSKGVASNIEDGIAEIKRLRAALQKIADCDLEYGVAHRVYAKDALGAVQQSMTEPK
jgi:hypothetical protein